MKPHGALYMEMAVNAELSGVFIDYMRQAAPGSFVFCMPGSATDATARVAGQPVVREFYVDRDYDDTGSIVFVRDAARPDLAARERDKVRRMVRTIRDRGYAMRDPHVEPRTSDTIAVPIFARDVAQASIGITYFRSAMNSFGSREGVHGRAPARRGRHRRGGGPADGSARLAFRQAESMPAELVRPTLCREARAK